MKRFSYFILLLVSSILCGEVFAQQVISISESQSDTIHVTFYVRDILDSRPQKTNIGINLQGKPINVKLGLRNALIRYSDFCIKEQSGQRPVVLEVTSFEVKPKDSSHIELIASIQVLLPSDSGLALLFPLTEHRVSDRIHDTLIVDQMIRNLMNSVFKEVNDGLTNQVVDVKSLVVVHPKTKDEVNGVISDEIVDKGRLRFMVIGSFVQGTSARSIGMSIAHIRIAESKNSGVGGIYTLSKVSADPTSIYRGAAVVKIGILPVQRIVGPLWLYFPVQIPVFLVETSSISGFGKTVTERKVHFGFDASIGFCLMPDKFGTFIGVRGYGVVTSSSLVYTKDYGVAIDFGLKF